MYNMRAFAEPPVKNPLNYKSIDKIIKINGAFIYLGNLEAAKDGQLLNNYGIKAVLTVCREAGY